MIHPGLVWVWIVIVSTFEIRSISKDSARTRFLRKDQPGIQSEVHSVNFSLICACFRTTEQIQLYIGYYHLFHFLDRGTVPYMFAHVLFLRKSKKKKMKDPYSCMRTHYKCSKCRSFDFLRCFFTAAEVAWLLTPCTLSRTVSALDVRRARGKTACCCWKTSVSLTRGCLLDGCCWFLFCVSAW